MNRNAVLQVTIPILVLLLLVSCGTEEVGTTPTSSAATPLVTEGTTQTETATATPLTMEPTAAGMETLFTGTDGFPWWNDVVFYEVFVRSFADSDGDGVGDINGLIERLDYLNDGNPDTTGDLGITGIWLMPVMESPSYHGYDVVDYYQVDEEYGTEEDFRRLIEAAHARGIRVVVDLVLNHTSSEHPWFQEAIDPGSERRDWYVWSDDNPGYRGPWNQTVWHKEKGAYYYGVFWEGMPDLNFNNPEVTAATYEAARFWLEDMGVDGFRLDAIKHLIEDGKLQENTPATHNWLQGFYTYYKGVNPNAFTVGEAWTGTQQVLDYTGDEVDVAFQFDLAEDILNTSREGIGSLFAKEMAGVVASYPSGQYATFIANHDQNRVMSQLRGDEGAAKVSASLLLTSPGVPFIYYGEEIGMMGEKPDEDIRRPMQWSGDGRGAGFTTGRPWRPPNDDYEERNVANQAADPGSLLNHYRQLVHLRNTHEALRIGDWKLLDTKPARLLAFLRFSDDETLLVLINPSSREIDDYQLSLESSPLSSDVRTGLVLGSGEVASLELNAAGGFAEYQPLAVLPPQSTYIITLE